MEVSQPEKKKRISEKNEVQENHLAWEWRRFGRLLPKFACAARKKSLKGKLIAPELKGK